MTKFVAIPPRGCRASLTPGKEYRILKFKDCPPLKPGGRGFFEIIDDNGRLLAYCKETRDAYLNGRDWTILDTESDTYKALHNNLPELPRRQKIEGVAKGIAFVYIAALAVMFVVAVGYALFSIVKPLLPW